MSKTPLRSGSGGGVGSITPRLAGLLIENGPSSSACALSYTDQMSLTGGSPEVSSINEGLTASAGAKMVNDGSSCNSDVGLPIIHAY